MFNEFVYKNEFIQRDARTWLEIDLDAIAHNIDRVAEHIATNAGIGAVIKADAYGHGAVEIARMLENNSRVNYLMVACFDEAFQLRHAGVKAPIFVFGITNPALGDKLADLCITQTIHSYDYATALNQAASKGDRRLRVHIKLDTGLNRLGIRMRNLDDLDGIYNLCRHITSLSYLSLEGIYTHFAMASDPNPFFTQLQFERFISAVNSLKERGVDFRSVHCSNSAAMSFYPNMNCSMVRIGNALYGFESDPDRPVFGNLKGALQMKSRIIQLRTVPAGESVGYGLDFIANKPIRAAIISVGSIDGYPKALSKNGKILINGCCAPIIGRIAMDSMTVDVSDISNVYEGQTVTVFGHDGKSEIPVTDISLSLRLHPISFYCSLGKRLPKLYFKRGAEYRYVPGLN